MSDSAVRRTAPPPLIFFDMFFKDLKQNYPVYILDKATMALKQGKVMQASFPRMDMNPAAGKTGMVVDISIEADGKVASYVFPEGSSVAYAGTLVLSVDRQGLIGEVEAMKAGAEQAIAEYDRQKEVLDKATGLLAELNPAFKEKQDTEKRFGQLESSMNELKDMFAQFMRKQGAASGPGR